ncbi:unnamed protein product [Plutella xylostella]|uniref:(diamondback moth) hypothetical protein n=1 Tax=Plutella xylostella TaxID=51655 RepID=A0A8S4FPE0_PLUXY|nr:unnamed protein product [Plutella xylostella]
MACPFRRAASQQQFSKGGASGAQKPEMRSRQSSVHLPGPEEEDSDRNTLTLKHLSEALKLLTAPSVSRTGDARGAQSTFCRRRTTHGTKLFDTNAIGVKHRCNNANREF